MKKCIKCGDIFTAEDVREWKTEREAFWTHPFICPDCYDAFSRQDLEKQFEEICEKEGKTR